MNERIDSPYLVAANCKRGAMLFNKHEHIMAYALAVYGEFAEDELERLERYLKPGMTVVDVGANIGTHATAFAQMVQGGIVYAIEPHPCNFNILCGNVALRGTQTVLPFRVMAGAEDKMHVLPLIDAESPRNFGDLTALDMVPNDKGGLPTPEMRIDSMGLPACDLIKIDVEGHEPQVLAGATETIAKYRPVILAECLVYKDNQVRTDEAQRKLVTALPPDYRLYWLNTRLYRPNNFRGSTEDRHGHDRNILAVPRPIPELTEGLTEL